MDLRPEKAHCMIFGKKSHIDTVNLIGMELGIVVQNYLISCKNFVWESSTKKSHNHCFISQHVIIIIIDIIINIVIIAVAFINIVIVETTIVANF